MISTIHAPAIKALAKIEGFKNDIEMYRSLLGDVPLWRPGVPLKKQCDEALRLISELEERFGRKLVVTLLGPCGSGKSTLLNALAGVDELSETGIHRPTTQSLVVLSRDRSDADALSRELGRENVKITSSHGASSLEYVLLIDTPDTDSTEQKKHIPLVHKAIEVSDVLVCVFDAENPKRRDYVDFLAPYVRKFSGESIIAVINKCDRLEEHELKERILPEFGNYIKEAWQPPASDILCVSGRRHLHDPRWDQQALPKHDFDQFEAIRKMIFGTFNSPGYIVDRRLENAGSLRDYVIGEIRAEAEKDRETLETARANIKEAQQRALTGALSALERDDSKQLLGVNVLLYQKLSQRWLGPVGWLIAIWARILIFGVGIAAIFRFGNPIRQIWGIVSSLRHFKDSQAAVAETGRSETVDTAFREYRLSIKRDWPDIGENLVKGRFEKSVRRMEDMIPDSEIFSTELSGIWRDTLVTSIDEASKKLSGLLMQFLFNMPVIVIMGHVAWVTAREYFSGNYLSSGFFLHAFLTISLVLFILFFIFQACVRLIAGSDRLIGKAFEKMKSRMEQYQPLSVNPVSRQVEDVLMLTLPDHSADQP
jgi:GTPase SAR1 family protein